MLRAALASLILLLPAVAHGEAGPPGLVDLPTGYGYSVLLDRLDKAVAAADMTVVARASATIGAAQRGITIPGNAVVMVFRNDFAVRLLAASLPAGIEAPLRFYVTEGTDGHATLHYRRPSAVLAPYGAPAVDQIAAELDPIFDRVARDAAGP